MDPRSRPKPRADTPPVRTRRDPAELERLHDFCREARLYDVEVWIGEGRPLQLTPGTPVRGRRHRTTALEIALDREDHDLVHLLLCNGYDPNVEKESPLDAALRARREDLLDLLLEWGADPHGVSRTALFETYRSDWMERFRDFGIDLTDGHELADVLAERTSNNPLYGFVRRHRERDPKIQR